MSDAELASRLRTWAVANQNSILHDLKDLVALDAPSGDLDLLDANAELFEQRVGKIGGQVRRHPSAAGTHLEIHFGPNTGKPILVLGHYDTVWPRGTAAARPLSFEGGVIRGPGVFDMRGGLVAALNGIAALTELGDLNRSVVVLLTADEETGSRTSEDLIVRLGDDSVATIIPEPSLSNGGLKTQRKGVLTYRLSVQGRASHAGLDPERGISAIHELLHTLQDVLALEDLRHGLTVNVGVVAGGSRSNVVAAEASADIDVRVATMDQYTTVESWFRERQPRAVEATVSIERLHGRPPMERTAAVAAAAARTRAAGDLLGLILSEGAAGGGSDGNFLACRGVAVVDGLGPVGGGAHALGEHILFDSLIERTALLGLLVAVL